MVRGESLRWQQVALILATDSVGDIAGCAGTGDDAETNNNTDGSNDSNPNLRETETNPIIHIEDENRTRS